MSEIRVMAVINGLGTGGAERSFLELLPSLIDAGVRLEFVSFYHREDGVESAVRQLDIPVTILTERSPISRVLALRKMIERERPEVIHTTLFEADVIGRISGLKTSSRVLTSIVNTSYDRAREGDPNVSKWRLEAVRHIDGLTARHATDHFHALTKSAAESAVRRLGVSRTNISVIPRARDPQRLDFDFTAARKSIREEFGLGDRPVVVTVGRQEFQKGHVVLIEAMHHVKQLIPDALLLLVGRRGNASLATDETIDRWGLRESVIETGHREDVPALLAASDTFAFPSLYEGFGGALVEALAVRTPIVCSAIPPLEEVLAGTGAGKTVVPGDARDLAAGLIEALERSDEVVRGTMAGRRLFEERYTPSVVAPAMVSLYRMLAAAT